VGIRFNCKNPKCGKLILAPDDMAGKSDRCPGCGQPIIIPYADGVLGFEDEAQIEAIRFIHEESLRAEAAKGERAVRCLECARLIPAEAVMCPMCGRPYPATPVARIGSERVSPPGEGSLVGSCLRAIVRPGVDSRCVGKAGLFLAAVYLLYRGLFDYLRRAVPGAMNYSAAFWAVLGILALAAVGYALKVYLRHVSSSVAGLTTPPPAPKTGPVDALVMGLLAVGVAVVYVFPLATLALLPVALLALSVTNDLRVLDFRWPGRVALMAPDGFAILWAMLLVSVGLAVGVFFGSAYVVRLFGEAVCARLPAPEGDIICEAIVLLGVIPVGVLTALAGCAAFRCIGLFGRYRPDIFHSLPRRRNILLATAVLAVGAAISTIIFSALLQFVS